MSAPRFDVAGTGSMVVDVIGSVPELGRGDAKILLRASEGRPPLSRHVGGVTLNHLGWAAALGLRTAIFGKIADDADGRLLRAGMAALGIEDHLDPSGSHSAFAHVYVDAAGERCIYMARGATAELTPDEIDRLHAGVIERADLVSSEVSQVPLATLLRVLVRAQAAGARSVVDLDVPGSAAVPGLGTEAELHEVLRRSDVLKCSLRAAAELVPGAEPVSVAGALAERFGIGLVVLTAGAEGAWLAADSERLRAEAIRVRVVDSTGAGDAFLGGLLCGLARGLPLADLARLATACGAACCEQIGAFPDPAGASRDRALALYAKLGGTPFASPAAATSSREGARVREETERFLASAATSVSAAVADLDRDALRAAADLVESTRSAGGRVHVTGVGKPEHVARYAAALLSSTGTPAVFLHATEATHGSVGQLEPGDLLVAISNSGATEELLRAVDAARARGARLLAVTGAAGSPLAERADRTLVARADDEGGPLGLAPRNSILLETLVLAALSVELQQRSGLSRADYHERHPAGSLGRATRD